MTVMPIPASQLARLGPVRVLLVEDEAMVAMLVEDELLEAGAQVLGPAASVEEALRLLDGCDDGGLDIGVLDMNLGGRSVLPVADALARRAVPFIFMTGYGDTGSHGPHAEVPVLQKPFSPCDLVAILDRLLAPPKPA
jgi:DNA-binding response OmpR family regulator